MQQSPYVCSPWMSYTLWFNALFYALLVGVAVRRSPQAWALWKGLAVHVLPFWVLSQYIMWQSRVYVACKRPLWFAAGSDIFIHWLPLVLTVILARRTCRISPDWIGGTLLAGGGLLLAYMALARGVGTWTPRRGMYNLPLGALAALYLPTLFISCIVMMPSSRITAESA